MKMSHYIHVKYNKKTRFLKKIYHKALRLVIKLKIQPGSINEVCEQEEVKEPKYPSILKVGRRFF